MKREELEKLKIDLRDSAKILRIEFIIDESIRLGICYGFEKGQEQKTVLKDNGGYFTNKYESAEEVLKELYEETLASKEQDV